MNKKNISIFLTTFFLLLLFISAMFLRVKYFIDTGAPTELQVHDLNFRKRKFMKGYLNICIKEKNPIFRFREYFLVSEPCDLLMNKNRNYIYFIVNRYYRHGGNVVSCFVFGHNYKDFFLVRFYTATSKAWIYDEVEENRVMIDVSDIFKGMTEDSKLEDFVPIFKKCVERYNWSQPEKKVQKD